MIRSVGRVEFAWDEDAKTWTCQDCGQIVGDLRRHARDEHGVQRGE